jgi:hypothetical protein
MNKSKLKQNVKHVKGLKQMLNAPDSLQGYCCSYAPRDKCVQTFGVYRNMVQNYGLHSANSEQIPVANFCEYENEVLDSIKVRNFLL